MEETPSRSSFIERLQAGDPKAEEQLYTRYAQTLIQVAQKNLGKVVKRRLDAEDVVQSVFRTFIRRNAEGEFQIKSSDKLWRLLVKITVLKRENKCP